MAPQAGETRRKGSREGDGAVLEAIKVDDPNFLSGSEARYAVIERGARNKRLEARRRTHLQCGIVLDRHKRFLIDCQVYDRSRRGARLRLAAEVELPRQILLFDERAAHLLQAEIAWRRGHSVGVILNRPETAPLTEAEITALRRKFYFGPAPATRRKRVSP
ncbi:MAG TPA: hypothetical protein VKV77_00825 [Methylovirgula sp.]|nr:hypothetical protein [Methylovirgula sp.]